LAATLGSLGHDVIVYAGPTAPDRAEAAAIGPRVALEPVAVKPLTASGLDTGPPLLRQLGRRLREMWRAERPEVVHAHSNLSGVAALSAVGDDRLPPVIQTFHGFSVTACHDRAAGHGAASDRDRLCAQRTVARRAAAVVATCADELTELVRLGVPRSRLSVIPYGVDTERWHPDGPSRPRANRYRLVVVGSLAPHRGVDDAVQALARVPDTELVVAGGPPAHRLLGDRDARRIREFAERLGVGARVRLLGRIPHSDVPSLMRGADLVVCVPRCDVRGVVAVEAMACGVPVVATAVGALADSVVDGITGRFAPSGCPRSLGRIVHQLLTSPVYRAQLGWAARDRAVARYSWPRIAAETQRLYERLGAEAR
jgi:glycosyltransferase involved in cell wall biosynthesis